MINIVAKENNSSGKLELTYSGTSRSYQQLVIRSLGVCDLVVDNTTNPLLIDFLNYSSRIELNVNKPGVYDIEFFFLNQVVRDYVSVEDNKLIASGIFNSFIGEYIFLDDLYFIDKARSGENFLYLDRPIGKFSGIFMVDIFVNTVSYLWPVKGKMVDALKSIKCDTDLTSLSEAVNTIRLIELACDGQKKKDLFNTLNKCWID